MHVTLLALHVLAAVFWVGGMAFAHTSLRPAALALDPPIRLALWRRVFGRFLPLAGASVGVLLLTGFAMVFFTFGGFEGVPVYVDVMATTGIAMALLFLYLVLGPWRGFRAAVEAATWPEAGLQLGRIRRIVEINLGLGALTIVAAVTGRYW